MIKRSALFILITIFINQVSSAEVWSKIMHASNYEAMANTSQGLIIGEFDQRTNLNPYNGLLISKDLGKTWNNFGLQGRGVTDIVADNERVFATTYFVKDKTVGLFLSLDKGATWKNIGPSFSAASVAIDKDRVYLASYSHGLWVSNDGGQTFTQKVGSGFYGPTFNVVQTNGKLTIAGAVGKTYVSKDKGTTWIEIPALAGKQIKYVDFEGDLIFVGTHDVDGIFKSSDNGNSWKKLDTFGTTSVGSLAVFNDALYAGKTDTTLNKYSLFKSVNDGESWSNIGPNIDSINVKATSIAFAYAHPSKTFITFSSDGIYSADIAEPQIETFNFLKIPWETQNTNDLFDRIYSYFDHEYPLLGYSRKIEPTGSSTTTLNFLNKRAPQPEMYYSSHSGVDFKLPYGTEIRAPANGIAEYYTCDGCGNAIKIDHLNGYQTIYMHLQKNGLITNGNKVEVTAGDVIGKVGLTGNTTGPHLHFEVTTDANGNNIFSDDFPQSRVDPFGWLEPKVADPWYNYLWEDSTGKHLGQQSKYLWEYPIPKTNVVVTPDINSIDIENKKIDITESLINKPFNIEYKTYGEPQIPKSQDYLKYVAGSSFLLDAVDTLGTKIENFGGKIKFTLDLSSKNVNADTDSIKLFFYNNFTGLWEVLTSTYNTATQILSAETTHLSQFAAFELNADTTPPNTDVSITYSSTGTAIITMHSQDNDKNKTFYSIDNDEWQEYTGPVDISEKGIHSIKYRSSDMNDNYENENEKIIPVGVSENWKGNVKITGGYFITL